MPSAFVSTGTVAALVLGVLIGFGYLRYMWASLQKAVETRDETDEGNDRYHFSFAGAVIAVVASSGAIAFYGASPALLYVGPALALLSAVAVGYCLRQEYLGE
jgi:hypothetical protein